LQFEFVLKPTWVRWLGRLPGLAYLSYNLWHRKAYQAARRLHARVGFDLVHQVNFCGYREPSYLWQLGVPFIWGPVGGTQNYPWQFLPRADWRGAIREALRSVVNKVQLCFSPRVRQAARKAAVLLAANSTVQADFARAHHVQPVLQLETGLRAVGPPRQAARHPGGLRILWSGELQPWKALHLLIEALGQLPKDVNYELRILGRGPLDEYWHQLAREKGVDRNTTWMGWLPHGEALKQYEWADLLAFTSLRDTSGNVVLEAIAAGLPVVCLDHQGVRDIITPECGIKVPVTRPEEVINGLTEAITSLACDPGRRERLGQGARERAKEYLWSRQGERMAAVYRQVLNGRGMEP
jgi:glycosyltransferase involved in cell wall biosynthesis